MAAHCPICGKDDQIQKVSSIVENGTSTGTYSGPAAGVVNVDGKPRLVGSYSTMSGSTTTRLAQMFAPPTKPGQKGSCWLVVGMVVIALMVLNTLGFALRALLAGINDPTDFPVIASLALFIFAGLLIIPIWLIARQLSKVNRWNQQEHPKEISEWQRKIAVYDRLYFCHRDDAVFDPNSGRHASPQELGRLLAAK